MWDVRIDCDDGGFGLQITHEDGAEEGSFYFTLSAAQAEALYDQSRARILPWLMERDAAKVEYDRMKRAGDTRLLTDEEFSAYVDDAYGDNWSKRVGMEQAREGGYA